jgi:polyisoprenoid-binding protein YceI
MKKWIIDPAHSEIAFKVKHLMISTVRGIFSKFEGNIISEDDTFNNGVITFSADINSLDTHNTDRNSHLLSPDFFDVEKFPKMSFVSTSVKRIKDHLTIIGNLTIKGITKSVEIEAIANGTNKGMEGEKVTGFDLSTSINRKDFGLVWNVSLETGGILVGETVDIEIFLEIKEQ